MSLKLALSLRWPPHQCLSYGICHLEGRARRSRRNRTQDLCIPVPALLPGCLAEQCHTSWEFSWQPGQTCTVYNFYQPFHIFLWFCITQSDRGHPKFRAGLHIEPQLVVKNCSSSIFHHKKRKQSSIPMVTVSLYLFKTSK